MLWRLRLLLLAFVLIFVTGALIQSCTSNSSSTPTFIPPPAGFNLDVVTVCEGSVATVTPTPAGPTPKAGKRTPTPTVTPCPQTNATAAAAQSTAAFHALGSFTKGNQSQTLDITNSAGTLWTSNDPAVLIPPGAGAGGEFFAATPGCACANASSGGVISLPVSVAVATGVCPACPTPLPTVTATPKAAVTVSAARVDTAIAQSAGVLLWTHDAGASAAGAIALNSDGGIYFVTGDGALHAIDSAAHSLVTRTGLGVAAPVVGPDGTIYAQGANGDVIALAPNGGTHWQAGLNGRVTPLAASNSVVVVSSSQELIALGPSGATDWQLPITGAKSAVALSNDGFAVDTSSAVIVISGDGAVQWSFAIPHGTAGALTATDVAIYAASRDGVLYALDPATGAELWHLDTPAATGAGPVVALSGGVIYFASDQLYALAPDGQVMWSGAIPGGTATSLTAGGGSVIATSADGTATAISTSGAILWSSRSFGEVKSVAASPGGTVYIASKSGRIFAVR